jgi:2-methylisocitrate lyase-like PEP mutase family enzyme
LPSLGRRDGEGAVSRDEALAHAQAIVSATPLPVSADLENGFGDDPETAAETVRLAAETGLVGASIEDATGDPEHPIYDASLAIERIAAAVEAARALPFPFTLTARAENFLHGHPDLDDTIRRLQAFEAAGVDVLYAPGLRDLAMIRSLCAAVGRPVNVIVGLAGAPFSVEQLAAAGVRRISLGSALSRGTRRILARGPGGQGAWHVQLCRRCGPLRRSRSVHAGTPDLSGGRAASASRSGSGRVSSAMP